MHMLNKRGPRTEPWGTPYSMHSDSRLPHQIFPHFVCLLFFFSAPSISVALSLSGMSSMHQRTSYVLCMYYYIFCIVMFWAFFSNNYVVYVYSWNDNKLDRWSIMTSSSGYLTPAEFKIPKMCSNTENLLKYGENKI